MNVARHHAEWLSLVDYAGPFLSLAVLLDEFPDGLDKRADAPRMRERLHLAYQEWLDDQDGLRPDPAIHRAWIDLVLREVLDYQADILASGQDLPAGLRVTVAEHGGAVLAPTVAVIAPPGHTHAGRAELLVDVVPRRQSLERATPSGWKASPVTRMMTLLHGTGVRLGLVSNGEHFALIHAEPNQTTSVASFHAHLWFEEPLTLRALYTTLCARRLFGVPDDRTLRALLERSRQDQHDVTDQLGAQVRRAVEVLIQTIDRLDRDRKGALLDGFDEQRLYQAAVTVMMRLVFLLAAEERELLRLGDPLYDQHYALSTLRDQLQEVADQHGDEVLRRRHDAWSRLLALFRAVYGGIDHEDLRMPAYGGSLFDPDRFPFLEGRARATSWRTDPADPLPIDNLTVLDLLNALQVLRIRLPGGPAEARRLRFKGIGVEQIGHVYEGLLDHTAVRATGPVISLRGAGGREPEVEVDELVRLQAIAEGQLVEYLHKRTGRGEKALKRALTYEIPPDRLRAWSRACDNRQALLQRVTPWAGLVREDDHGVPVVYGEGSVYVTEGQERRATGTHYTPRSLTEPIVQHALEPLVYIGPAEGRARAEWQLHTPAEILALRVCDLAMGSGAFLVQTCRYLAERLVDAWDRAEEQAGGRLVVTPEGDLSTGDPGERPLPRDPDERAAIARRHVADRCLYGVDKNPMAVEMAKLSLWLVTLQKDRPFTFLDHALRCGDSLLGLHRVAQIENFHMAPDQGGQQMVLGGSLIRAAFERAAAKRRELESFPVETIRDAERKARLLGEARDATDDVRLVADLIASAALWVASYPASALDELLASLAPDVAAAVDPATDPDARAARRRDLAGKARRMLDDRRPSGRPGRRPFHWMIEFPEVFADGDRAGFDAFVGNPPFRGGKLISGIVGKDYREFLVTHLADDTRGHADLCAYFVLRAASLVCDAGQLGMVATNTIAQGDTREVGLDRLLAQGYTISRAVSSQPWPGTASLEVAHLWLRRGAWDGERMLDDCPVSGISAYLARPGSVTGKPHRLAANAGKSFQGSIVLGLGFTMSLDDAQGLIERNPRNRDVLFPYLNGKDLNSSPTQSPSRWVINFRDWPLDHNSAPAYYKGPVASDYPDCLSILREKIKPERAKKSKDVRKAPYWQFWRARAELYAAIEGMAQVLITSRVSAHHFFALSPTRLVFSERLVAFSFSEDVHLALLSSSVHDTWAHRPGATTHETRNTYFSRQAFETYPFPPDVTPLVQTAGSYVSYRRSLMLDRQEGLTQTYNRFHDLAETSEDIHILRGLHVDMDQAVARAYGWDDLDLGHGFHETRQGVRFTLSGPARREVLDRLLALNHQRYAEEVAQGLHEKKSSKKQKSPRRAGKPAWPKATPAAQTGFDFSAAPPAQATSPAPDPDVLDDHARAVLDALRRAGEPLGKADILAAAGIPASRWTPTIRTLQDAGLVTRHGAGRATRYTLADPR